MAYTKLSPNLERAAQVASTQEFFVGAAIESYKQRHRLGDTALRKMLGCSVENLVRLRLCRRLHPSEEDFGSQVTGVAQFVSCNRLALTRILIEHVQDPGQPKGER